MTGRLIRNEEILPRLSEIEELRCIMRMGGLIDSCILNALHLVSIVCLPFRAELPASFAEIRKAPTDRYPLNEGRMNG